MSERVKICIDRLLPRDVQRPQHTRTTNGRAEAIIVHRKMWVNGSRLRVRFLGGTAAEKQLVREQAAWWTAHANLEFVFDDDPAAEIRISFDTTDGAWSYVGTDASEIPLNQATMNLGFLDGGTAAHEFGHSIGLGHEHQNPAGGIIWNEAVVLRDLAGPPNSWSEEQIRHNVLRKYEADQIRGTTFDPQSIMLYFFPASWVQSGVGTEANEILSALDKAFIASAQAYPRTAATSTPLEVNGDSVLGEIEGVGEEDLYTLEVASAGRHVIETDGHTDVVVKLFGPDSNTALIAEDDDGGVGLNSRIVTELVPGDYFVQVRHYNRTAGTGQYRITARR